MIKQVDPESIKGVTGTVVSKDTAQAIMMGHWLGKPVKVDSQLNLLENPEPVLAAKYLGIKRLRVEIVHDSPTTACPPQLGAGAEPDNRPT